MMLRMGAEVKSKRFIESWLGKLALLLLAAVWIFSMSGVDKNAYSAFPVTVAVGVVALLIVAGVCMGYKLVRMSWLGWVSLIGVGGYFYARCCMSYSVVEAWREGALILGCMIFYLMGVYAAQLKGNGWLHGIIVVSVALNIIYFYLMNATDVSMIYTGRPEIGLTGVNTRPVTLFLYKNVAGLFLMLGGVLLINTAFYQRQRRWLYGMVGIVAVVLSCYCNTRVIYLLFPVLCVVSWLLHFLFALYSDRPMRWGWIVSGIVIFVFLGIMVSEFVFAHSLFEMAMNVDTNSRSYIWKYGLKVAFDVPLWGCGASSFLWEILPIFDNWMVPDHAHNEYLQVWIDYGLMGLLMMVGILVLHIVNGFCAYVSEQDSKEHREMKAIAITVLIALSICVFTDFIWHFYSMATMTAFCCGMLASPFPKQAGGIFRRRIWVSADSKSTIKVVAQGRIGRVFIMLLCLSVLAFAGRLSVRLYPAWIAQWEFNSLCNPGKDEKAVKRHHIQEAVVHVYPDAAIMDYFYMLPLSGVTWQQQEDMMKSVLKTNPKNLFAVTMLGDVLSWQMKCREAEALYRKYYSISSLRGAMKPNCIRWWHSYYAYNLLRWGYQKMKLGDVASAYSMMDYALNIHAKHRIIFTYSYGSHSRGWKGKAAIHPEAPMFIRTCAKNVEMFKMLRIQKDDSWMAPMEDGGSRALYPEWGNKARAVSAKFKKGKHIKNKR